MRAKLFVRYNDGFPKMESARLLKYWRVLAGAAILTTFPLFAEEKVEPGQVLLPGNGFNGPTQEPKGKSGETDAKAIAHWDIAPHQTFSDTLRVGVVAFHINGIDRVEFSANGGNWVAVKEMTHNPDTDVYEYWITLHASDFKDGPVELRTIAYPKSGQPRLLEPLPLNANGHKTLPEIARYVSPKGNDSAGDGTKEKPFATIAKAASIVQSASPNKSADGGIIYLLPGEHRCEEVQQKLITKNRYLHICAAPGVAQYEVRLIGNSFNLKTDFLYLSGVTIRTAVFSGKALWCDQCDFFGYGIGNGYAAWKFDGWTHGGIGYMTNCTVENCQQGLINGKGIERNVHIKNISAHALDGSPLVVNCTVDYLIDANKDPHDHIYQFMGMNEVIDNIILYGVQVTHMEGGSIVCSKGKLKENIAFVNVSSDFHSSTGGWAWWGRTPTNHLLFWNCTFNESLGLNFDAEMGMRNISVVGCVFRKANKNEGETGKDIKAETTQFTIPPGEVEKARKGGNDYDPNISFQHNHFVDSKWAPGKDATTGDPKFVNVNAADFRPAENSPLRGRLAQPLVPVDIMNNPLSTPASIGAFQPVKSTQKEVEIKPTEGDHVIRFNNTNDLKEWKMVGQIGIETSKEGHEGVLKLTPGSSAMLPLRVQDGSGKIEFCIYDDMTIPEATKAYPRGAKIVGPRWGLVQEDGHVLVIGNLYDYNVPGNHAYTAVDSDQKNWIDYHYLGVDRTKGWHKFTFAFDENDGLTLFHDDQKLTKFYWNDTKLAGFNGIVLFGAEQKLDGQNLWVADIGVTLKGDVLAKIEPTFKPNIVRKNDTESEVPFEILKQGRPAILAYQAGVPVDVIKQGRDAISAYKKEHHIGE